MPNDPEYLHFIATIEQSLSNVLHQTKSSSLTEAAKHLCLGKGGKRVRPHLVWSFSRCLQQPLDTPRLVDIAVVAELIHSASLMHDDVVDQGSIRRGRPTVNVQWGNIVAVLAGDLLLTQAFVLLQPYPKHLTIEATATIASMTEAAISEVEARSNLDQTPEEWRRVVEGKTGALFAWCGRAVANLAQDGKAGDAFVQCGLRLGVAFQLADDLLDLIGTRTGKDRFSDLKNRETNFAVLSAAADSPDFRTALLDLWDSDCSPPHVQKLGAKLAQSNTIPQTMRLLDSEIERALSDLNKYQSSVGGLLIKEWAAQLRKRLEPELFSAAADGV
ncbi:MAG: polyprenyl synthetase family protein [Pseudomonadota bacterium]